MSWSLSGVTDLLFFFCFFEFLDTQFTVTGTIIHLYGKVFVDVPGFVCWSALRMG